RRRDRRAARRRTASRADGGGGAPARAGELLVGRHRRAARRHLRAGRDGMTILRSVWLRVAAVLIGIAAVVVLLWWRGPDWHTVGNAFTAVVWAWVASDRLQPPLGDRALDRMDAGHRRRDPEALAPLPVDLLGVLGGADGERGAAGPDWRARPRRRAGAQGPAPEGALGDARRNGLRAPCLRPRTRRAADPLRRDHREDPRLGDDVAGRLRRRRHRALLVRLRERQAPLHDPAGR